MPSPPLDPDALMTRRQLAVALTEAGYPVKYTGLQTMAHRCTGPRYRRFGVQALYRGSDVLEWLEEKLGPPRSGPAEGRALNAARAERKATAAQQTAAE